MSKAVDRRNKTLTLSLSQSTGRGDQSGNGHMRLPCDQDIKPLCRRFIDG